MSSFLFFVAVIYFCFNFGESIYSSNDLDKLINSISGEIIEPNSSEYDDERQQFDASNNGFPKLIIKCDNKEDVRKSVQFVLDFDETFVVRSGAHSTGGYSTCNNFECIMIDLDNLTDLKIYEDDDDDDDDESYIPSASFGPGLQINQVAYSLEFGSDSGIKYWVPLGLDDVGIGGHIHGGAWGWGLRQYGLGIDNLIEAKIVIIESGKAKIVRANEKKNKELFYCIRGVVGPSCGIVVEYKLKIFEQNVNGYSYTEMTAIGNTIDFQSNLDRITTIDASISDQRKMGIITFHIKPPFSNFLVNSIRYSFYDGNVVSDTHNYTNNLINKIENELGGFVLSEETYFGSYTYIRCVMQMGYTNSDRSNCLSNEILSNFTIPRSSVQSIGWLYDNENEYETFVNSSGYELLINSILNDCPTYSVCSYYMSTWGGKMNDIPSNETGFFHRNTKFDLNPYVTWSNPLEKDINFQFLDNLLIALEANDYTTKRVYDNYIIPSLSREEALDYYYGDNKYKLINSKCLWDPNDIFTNPQGIPVDSC